MHFPDDLKPPWNTWVRDLYSIARRCQGMARRQEGLAAIRILLFVNCDGCPVAWTEPKMTKLEPKERLTTEALQALVQQAEDAGVDLGELLSKL